nr:transposase [Pyrinomonadaceae bacterium]
MQEHTTTSTTHFSPRASLAAIGLKLRELKLIESITQAVKVPQKKVKFTPAEKLYDAFITILAGARGLNETTTRLRSDEALQRAFGRTACAEYSVIQDTLDACTPENVIQMKQVVATIFQQQSQAAKHDYHTTLQLLDVDMSSLPCGPKAELSKKGY